MRAKTKSGTINNHPIGIFDSGFGGLTVMSAITKMLPLESLIYFGDTAHVPYGSKSKDIVIKYSKEITSFLMRCKVKLIVIACNTASAFALSILQKTLKVPVIGVIEPGSKAAVYASKNKKIGIIGTEGTINSKSYLREINRISKSKVYQQACPLFVPLVEEGWSSGEITDSIVKKYIEPLLNKKIDTLVLGCTHYPLLRETLEKNAGGNVVFIDSAKAVSQEVKNILKKTCILADVKGKKFLKFYVSDNPEKFQTIGSRFFSKKISGVKKIKMVS
ncbi:glutamate racemase [Endomicrobiia bacterium]|uniref:Glutamate racemase n=1 Tax=Endomicrobium trichonymphae TaxID=1408204 RepID=B1GYS0_ENDTX|nr:glutamate racemase [Candidatus Endomicrobium trichonymphae]BAG14163.1 glutamate racemase [Candidatus Endomicrobium trichonymphae]GHT07967.1 glutamate racemase [Endomicrobiia bacterium]GHT16348.1 glutamate racemase [Endomicrobiia bacterium]GMO50971.1 MAG: glutamate racemase [Candidatus Endomicrobium trichonymphae]